MSKKKYGILSDSSPQTLKGSRLFSHIILWSVIIFIVLFFVWAKNAVLDEVTVGEGKVIPSRQIQVVQSLEGGIIRDIFVNIKGKIF